MKNLLFLFTIVLLLFSCHSEERNAFDDAIGLNTEIAYSEFIKNYPDGFYINEAKDLRQKLDSINIIISTFLGNEQRNFYGDSLPDRLDTIWRFYLGEGLSPAYGKDKIWKGAGWTGQPLLVNENGQLFVIQGAYDYGIHKIDALTGKQKWEYKFDDILKGTATIWINKNAQKIENRYVIIQGSRKGWNKDKSSKYCWSLRAVSYITGKELWRHNSISTDSYSRDVDGSALVINDTAYLALENAIFTVFNPDFTKGHKVEQFISPKIYKEIKYYTIADTVAHGSDLVPEASPTLLNNKIFTPSGTGWIYGYNIEKGKNDWEFYLGADLNGSLPVTFDNCFLVSIEKQYITGKGGVMKIDPTITGEKAVKWFMPTDTVTWIHWEGGIVGSTTINEKTKKLDEPYIAVFLDCAGDLYFVDYEHVNKDTLVWGPNKKHKYHPPVLLAKIKAHPTISTPIIVQNRVLAASDKGMYLYEFGFKNDVFIVELIDFIPEISCDATPITWNGRIYIASLDGYLYCLGKK
ncbi:MAG: PQQ-binding-like beta-propeller repeat protein [Bacteroidota bacterium]|nr:PQQ-binding-like beta-propeller repeat protein [Bacteroidota bacterium]